MKLFKHQLWHLIALTLLLFCISFSFKMDTTILYGELWGINTLSWMVLAILSPILHQIYVLFCWRLELHYKSISKLFGKDGFKLYKKGFILLILSRPVTITLLAISNANTIAINTTFSYVLSGILAIPVVYLLYSTAKYFGGDRVVGLDHFNPEEIRKKPFVRQGIFKYSPNAMYLFGFFLLWIPGFLLQSKAALLVAFFSHIYIWIHYYFTELPDIKVIYTQKQLDCIKK